MKKETQNKVSNESNTTKRSRRIEGISVKLADHDLSMRRNIKKRTHILKTKTNIRKVNPITKIIAYDFETSSIKSGTPTLKYLTAFSTENDFSLSVEVHSLEKLLYYLETYFLTTENNRTKFVAWNSNNYDVYFIAACLMQSELYVLRPYLTKSKSLRGLKVIPVEDISKPYAAQRGWEFVDGISMLGLQGTKLGDFLKLFSPDFKKIERESFETKEFDVNDENDILYAMRDSVGLFHGMAKAQKIVYEQFGYGLQTTIGNLGIKIFQTKIPKDVKIIEPKYEMLSILRNYVCRGGYCHLMRKYRGPVWKYDLNQAYAAAMRECQMPQGNCYYVKGVPKYSNCFICKVSLNNPDNKIPFYCKSNYKESTIANFVTNKVDETWITSVEYFQLKNEGWRIDVIESWAWESTFDMTEYVDQLETMRMNAEGGPKGAVGTVIKSIGNNSYGKTLEQLEPLELVLSGKCPEGYASYYGEENPSIIPYVWCRYVDTPTKNYHQPQIGAFITAYVRMVVRRAALINPATFLYADTDCVIFSSDVTNKLNIHASKYGAFKLEASNEDYMLIAKKVYASEDFKTKHAKGLNVKQLTMHDFSDWFKGNSPIQTQIQRQNFVKVMSGSEMFLNRTRKGTKIN
jgi:DNA polymerase type B, organellar and viral